MGKLGKNGKNEKTPEMSGKKVMSSTPNADSAFRTIELPSPPCSSEIISPIEEENEEPDANNVNIQSSMSFTLQYNSSHQPNSPVAKISRIHLNSKGRKMFQVASDNEEREDVEPLSPPPKWIVLEKALRNQLGEGKQPGIFKVRENGVNRENVKHTCQRKKDVHAKARVYSKCKEEIRKNRHAEPWKVSERALLEEYLDDEEAELPRLSNLNRTLYKIKEATRPANQTDLHLDMNRYVQAMPKRFFRGDMKVKTRYT
ncbi:hypothetical protein DAPPUDRAFT_113900 [Daphnia pulex]|uniref:Uncharacterized protein n=1 Tax=Daphnia pulex TaxID=6669 RepID=E9HGF9_DAPPU|nr:hypothetical protein DAPPUDRAFT_113900 [Daphnia pulex]|eukprot:EFX69176.1 hypothetical protein DAPPUDRAFT_113900 [Daphnia pulex]